MNLPSNIEELSQSETEKQSKRGGSGRVAIVVLVIVLVIAAVAAAAYFLVPRSSTPAASSQPAAAKQPTVIATAPPAPAGVPGAPGAPGGQAAPPIGAGPTATPDQRMAIQQTIARGNQAQAQAIASGDPTPMQQTSTAEFYQQLVQVNASLKEGGITGVRLDQIEWGPITVDGNEAVVVCFETWTTSFEDGTTEQSRDLNIYSLVNENGTWKIDANEHPTPPAAP